MKKVLFICLTMVGSLSMAQNTNLGTNAGNGGSGNTSLGANAGSSVTGIWNSFTGIYAGFNVTNGAFNVFSGAQAGYNANGSYNTFSGYQSGYSNQGNDNTFLGAFAGIANIAGKENTFTGGGSGQKSEGSFNTFTGYRSGFSNKADGNSFYGSYAGNNNTTGSKNTFMGYLAGSINKQAGYNTFIGSDAGSANVSGSFNTFLGAHAGTDNATGGYNVYLGTLAGTGITGGYSNIIIGYRAGENVSGNGNVLIGPYAGYGMRGSNKLYIENSSSPIPLIYGDFGTESIGLGTTNPGKYRLYVNGDAYATGLWLSSDKQFKIKGKEINAALDKVVAIKGRAYEFKQHTGLKKFSEGTHFGFYAQELQKVFPELVREDEDGYLAVNYIEMIPVLTEALKELAEKQAKLDVYEQRLNKIELIMAELSGKNSSESNMLEGQPTRNYSLGNKPNPAQNETVITYALPEGTHKASIMVFDLKGNEVHSFTDLSKSQGELTISSNMTGKGLFNYVLIVDGEIILTRKMIIQ